MLVNRVSCDWLGGSYLNIDAEGVVALAALEQANSLPSAPWPKLPHTTHMSWRHKSRHPPVKLILTPMLIVNLRLTFLRARSCVHWSVSLLTLNSYTYLFKCEESEVENRTTVLCMEFSSSSFTTYGESIKLTCNRAHDICLHLLRSHPAVSNILLYCVSNDIIVVSGNFSM